MRTEAELEGAYRLFNNEAVSFAHRPADPTPEVADDLDFISE